MNLAVLLLLLEQILDSWLSNMVLPLSSFLPSHSKAEGTYGATAVRTHNLSVSYNCAGTKVPVHTFPLGWKMAWSLLSCGGWLLVDVGPRQTAHSSLLSNSAEFQVMPSSLRM